MPSSIIRARTIFTEPADRRRWDQIEDGAVLQRDGVIAEIGPAADLIARHPEVPVLGTGRQVLLPGFVNAHHHVGLTPVQLGSRDMPLELWFVTRLVARRVDLYLDTLYSAFEMIASGITTVQHLHGWLPGDLAAVEAGAGEVIRAYQDIGMPSLLQGEKSNGPSKSLGSQPITFLYQWFNDSIRECRAGRQIRALREAAGRAHPDRNETHDIRLHLDAKMATGP